jgi:hypothetical protein
MAAVNVRFNLDSGHRGASLPYQMRKCPSADPLDLKFDKRPALTDAKLASQGCLSSSKPAGR